MSEEEEEKKIVVHDAVFYLAFDIDYIVAAFPGGIRFGKVICRNSGLVFDSHHFNVPQRKFDVFLKILESISQTLGGIQQGKENSRISSFVCNSYTISSKVCKAQVFFTKPYNSPFPTTPKCPPYIRLHNFKPIFFRILALYVKKIM